MGNNILIKKTQQLKLTVRLNNLTAMSLYVLHLENCHENQNQETYKTSTLAVDPQYSKVKVVMSGLGLMQTLITKIKSTEK